LSHSQPIADSVFGVKKRGEAKPAPETSFGEENSVAIAQWDNSYKTGRETVDAQHQQLCRRSQWNQWDLVKEFRIMRNLGM